MLSHTAIAQTWQPAMLRPKPPLAARVSVLGQACGQAARGSSCWESGAFFLFAALSRGVLGKEGVSAAPSLNDFSAN